MLKKTAKGLEDAFTTIDKKKEEKINAVKLDLLEGLDEELHASYLKQFKEVEKEIVRENILGQRRIDARSLTEVRNIEIETNFLPSVHGSHFLLGAKHKLLLQQPLVQEETFKQ